jgi:hypothetical protein
MRIHEKWSVLLSKESQQQADIYTNILPWELSICLTTPMYSTMALVERSWLPGLLNQVTRFLKSGCRFKVV